MNRSTETTKGGCEITVTGIVEISHDHWVQCFLHNDDKELAHG